MGSVEGVGTGPNARVRHGFEGQVTKALSGVSQYLPASSNVLLNGRAMTQPEIVAMLQGILQLFSDLRTARAVAQAHLKAARTELVPGHAAFHALKRAMQAYLGKGNPLLGEFGFSLETQKPRSAATQVKAQARSRLTRAARHTMGPRQKAAIQAIAPETVAVHPDGTVHVVPSPVDASATDSANGAAK